MNKKQEKAFEYAKARYGNKGKETKNEIAKVIACRVGYEAGWDEALKNQWISVKDKLPESCQEVFILAGTKEKFGMYRYIYFGEEKWTFADEKIFAWMPIPSFDNILKYK